MSGEESGPGWNWRVRQETPVQRLDRNWTQLVQELRVVQTGIQLLTGFLLILPFQSGFDDLSTLMRGIYLATFASAVGATVFLVAPVAWHRNLFRRRMLAQLVTVGHWCAILGVLLLGGALSGVAVLVVGVIAGPAAGIAAGGGLAFVFLLAWVAGPQFVVRSGRFRCRSDRASR